MIGTLHERLIAPIIAVFHPFWFLLNSVLKNLSSFQAVDAPVHGHAHLLGDQVDPQEGLEEEQVKVVPFDKKCLCCLR